MEKTETIRCCCSFTVDRARDQPVGLCRVRSWLKLFTVVQWDQRGAGRTLERTADRRGPSPSHASPRTESSSPTNCASNCARTRSFSSATRGDRSFESTWQRRGPISSARSSAPARWLTRRRAMPWPTRAFQEGGNPQDERAPLTSSTPSARHRIRTVVATPSSGDGQTCSKVQTLHRVHGRLGSHCAGSLTARCKRLVRRSDCKCQTPDPANEASSTTQTLAGEFAVPVFVIQGAEDFTTPTSLARAFVESIRAPRRRFVHRGGGHFAVFISPARFSSSSWRGFFRWQRDNLTGIQCPPAHRPRREAPADSPRVASELVSHATARAPIARVDLIARESRATCGRRSRCLHALPLV